jgi:hypothetical protein
MSDLAAFESKFRRLAELREQRDIDKKTAETSENEYREYEKELFESISDSALRGSVEFDFGGDLGVIRFQPRSTVYGQVIDKNAALDAFENEAIIDEMTGSKIEARRLNEYVRNRLESGQELPDGIGFYERKFFTISRKG